MEILYICDQVDRCNEKKCMHATPHKKNRGCTIKCDWSTSFDGVYGAKCIKEKYYEDIAGT